MATTILRLPTVKARTGLGSSTIYKFISEGRFPKAVALGDRAVGWVESEIQQYIEDRINSSRKNRAE
jgi:prophage regulatory protein